MMSATTSDNAAASIAAGTPATSTSLNVGAGNRRLKIGLVSISDRASAGVYQDQGIPALQDWFAATLTSPWETETRLIADEQTVIEQTLIELVDQFRCDLVLTTGGTGPSRRDVTPEATLKVASKEMPGFGEQMRQISLQFVPTAILSRQVAVIREIDAHAALILNLPGQPKSIKETLEGLKDANGEQKVSGIFSAIPYCIDLIGGPYIETNATICKVFRPKSALRPAAA
ncbi:molybdopterin adenylyltransferase [Glaciimonas sp. PAMC28666]|uniref:molybdopterin adenylyltransferase n=1 Tax=Glaciimonas sp. PAMC28666 TaxID=2807626 RepID=UPI001F04A0BE|nr:molybdopterin adenylyltransferase [Glaciimonas sp. PAMC28666]